ncbi:Xaa-Pro aminopeptidase 3 [Pyrus ussuriensis x Pyrus communis]|uniref:Xaa-Pro aminopeptidase 3 n=1 Tax=Pyrus ussuriensis x Pyrus communis TaxID=2448454 RepID=A0A5N5HET6_9ROSA|nr:Xaa-Pro aminopeptidase 3 [Pyrus ussuriensis x Pyrus communis]
MKYGSEIRLQPPLVLDRICILTQPLQFKSLSGNNPEPLESSSADFFMPFLNTIVRFDVVYNVCMPDVLRDLVHQTCHFPSSINEPTDYWYIVQHWKVFKADTAYPMSRLWGSSQLFRNLQKAAPTYTELDPFQKTSSLENLRLLLGSVVLLFISSANISYSILYHCTILYMNSDLRISFSVTTFNPVVCGGSNASVIHYDRNDQKIKDGALVLEDVGCEIRGYVSDLTRTWPSYGSFSSAQEELYDLILQTNKTSVELCEPGANIREIHNFSVEMLHKGLEEIGILKDSRSSSYHQMNPTSIVVQVTICHDCSTVGYDYSLKPGARDR